MADQDWCVGFGPRYHRDMATGRTSILFLTADPSDASRLRLSRELREIQTRLQMASAGDTFEFHHRASVRPGDLTQAIFDTRPAIVQFSGHGSPSGELLLENDAGKVHPVTTEALEALFALCKEVRCVVLNACYSRAQAQAIARHIDYVVGMTEAIGDNAAIAFSVGFYKALGAGRSIRDCFEFGKTELRLLNIPQYRVPALIQWPKLKHLFLDQSQYMHERTPRHHDIEYPPEYELLAKFEIRGGTESGSILIDPDAYSCIGHLLDDIYLHYLHPHTPAFSYGTEWLLSIGGGVVRRLLVPWQWFVGRDHDPAWQREISPSALGLERGCHGEILLSKGDLSSTGYLLIASDDDVIRDVMKEGGPKAIAQLVRSYLACVPPETFDGTCYRHKFVMRSLLGPKHGIFVDRGLSAQQRADLSAYWLR